MRAHDSVLLFSTFGPSFRFAGSTMPSADFCVLTKHVSMQGAIELLMSCCLFRVSLRDSHPSTADGYAGSLVNRVEPFRNSLMNLLSRDAQISPDKNVNFPCTNAAFTLSPEPVGFVMLCRLAQETKPYMRFLFVVSHVCAPASFRRSVALPPLPSASTFVSIHYS